MIQQDTKQIEQILIFKLRDPNNGAVLLNLPSIKQRTYQI